jgi:hypothetical protein
MKSCIVQSDGSKRWYNNNQLHREDGPAVIYNNGDESWYLNGLCHREDGPAITSSLYIQPEYWYLHGHYIPVKSQKEFEQYKRLMAFI